MVHNLLEGVLEDICFCPYEDVVGLGHSGGISTMLVPGESKQNDKIVLMCLLCSRGDRAY